MDQLSWDGMKEEMKMVHNYRMSQIMTAPPITVGPEERLHRAQRLMEKNKIRHLPVIVSKGEVVGILTDRDLTRASYYRYPESLRVYSLMKERPFCVAADSYAAEALCLMAEYKVGAVIVTTGRRTLEGIFTRSDALKLMNGVAGSRSLRPLAA